MRMRATWLLLPLVCALTACSEDEPEAATDAQLVQKCQTAVETAVIPVDVDIEFVDGAVVPGDYGPSEVRGNATVIGGGDGPFDATYSCTVGRVGDHREVSFPAVELYDTSEFLEIDEAIAVTALRNDHLKDLLAVADGLSGCTSDVAPCADTIPALIELRDQLVADAADPRMSKTGGLADGVALIDKGTTTIVDLECANANPAPCGIAAGEATKGMSIVQQVMFGELA